MFTSMEGWVQSTEEDQRFGNTSVAITPLTYEGYNPENSTLANWRPSSDVAQWGRRDRMPPRGQHKSPFFRTLHA